MNRKLLKYLKNKDKKTYTHLDNILAFYAQGNLQDLLSLKNAYKLGFFTYINRKGNSIEIYCFYYNLCIVLEFREDYYEYCSYEPGCSVEELEKGIIRKVYDEDFFKSLNEDSQLIKRIYL